MKTLPQLAGIAGILLALGSAGAQAAPVVTYGALPEWSNGVNPQNGNFTIATEFGMTIGLRAKYHYVLLDGSNGIYSAVAGPDPDNANKAIWNFDFSIDTGFATTGLQLADVTATLEILQIGTGAHQSFNLLTLDNTGGLSLAQNSENMAFSFLASQFPEYSIGASDDFLFTLTVASTAGTFSDQIEVSVPEPASMMLFGSAMAGIGFVRRRRLSRIA
jgi:hypothetical protein